MKQLRLLSSSSSEFISTDSSESARSARTACPRGSVGTRLTSVGTRLTSVGTSLMVSRIVVLSLLVLCIGCSEQSTQPPISDPYTKWQSYKLHDYTIDQVHACFCVNGGELMRITVRADTIAQVFRLSDSSIVQAPSASRYLTIDSLFSIIRNPGTDSLVIVYNAQYGYPEFLDINPQQHPFDGGILIETSNLRIP